MSYEVIPDQAVRVLLSEAATGVEAAGRGPPEAARQAPLPPKPRPKPRQVKRAVKKVAKEVREEAKETVKDEVQGAACETAAGAGNSFVPGTKVLMADVLCAVVRRLRRATAHSVADSQGSGSVKRSFDRPGPGDDGTERGEYQGSDADGSEGNPGKRGTRRRSEAGAARCRTRPGRRPQPFTWAVPPGRHPLPTRQPAHAEPTANHMTSA